MKRAVLGLVGALALSGCANVNEDALSRLQPGRTTVDQAMSSLGRPDRDETLADGSRMLTYVGSGASPRPANYIPIPGAVYAWGGWNVTSNEAGLMFGSDGLLRFWAWSTNQRTPIKVVGRDVVPHSAPDLDVRNESPLPEAGKGASPSQDRSGD
ncbi:hypothetical protein [Paramagnetospirillum kuznetsovii]|uniref:hypothetical protein n=1 Tax=Paramagnetospirillum kuznetsovii TaxID=2053833 RepID=UPI001864B6EF|nr:hypothetical protein [Paramagnetospirillum kuznetsovii]